MAEFPETNLSLIDRLQDAANEDGWREFLQIYQPVVYRMARHRGLQDADALDVTQQVFTSISRAIDRWKPEEDGPPFRAWLTTIASNAIKTSLSRQPRDRATGSTSIVELLDQESAHEDISEEMQNEARREVVRWAAGQVRKEFQEQTWTIFWQTAMEDVSVAEMAKKTGRSAGAIYVARHRVLARLKQKIAETSQHWELDIALRESKDNE